MKLKVKWHRKGQDSPLAIWPKESGNEKVTADKIKPTAVSKVTSDGTIGIMPVLGRKIVYFCSCTCFQGNKLKHTLNILKRVDSNTSEGTQKKAAKKVAMIK